MTDLGPMRPLRPVMIALLILLNTTICTTASLNVTTTTGPGPLRSLDAYLIFMSGASILFVLPILAIDYMRRGAVTSRIWFECTWTAVLWVLNLAGAAAMTALSTRTVCASGDLACTSRQLLVAITWMSTLLLLAQFLLVGISSVFYRRRHPEVWTSSVRDFQWFSGGGSGKSTVLGSGPPSPSTGVRELKLDPSNPVPRLERMVSEWQATMVQPVEPAQKTTRARDEPQPLTFSFAPELAPSRAPVHYNATAVFTVGVLPNGRRPSKKTALAPAPASLYPTSVQTAMNRSTEITHRSSPPKQSPPAILSTQANITVLSLEPPPIKNWPRANPQDPIRPSKKSATLPAATMAAPPAAAPASAPRSMSTGSRPSTSESLKSRPTGPRAPRHRPPPLDLSAALPSRMR